MSMNKWLSTGMILVAVAGLNGCEKLKNKPKDPLVEEEPSPFYGLQNGTEMDGKAGLGTYFFSNTAASSKFGFFDYLSGKVDDKYPLMYKGTFRPDRDFGWFSERNKKVSHFGGFDLDGRNWFMVNTEEESLNFQLLAVGLAEEETPVTTPPEEEKPGIDDVAILDGEFNCLQADVRPEAAVRHFDLTMANGDGQLVDKTQGEFATSQAIRVDLGEFATMVVSGTAQGFDKVCAGQEPEGFQDAFFDYLKTQYTDVDANYHVCWSAKTQGAFQLDGQALFYTTIAVPTVERRRYFDANFDGLEDSSGETMPTGWVDIVNNETAAPGPDGLRDGNIIPALPRDIADLATVTEEGLSGDEGFRPIRSTTFCLRKGEDLSAESLAGTYWMGQSIHDPLDDYVVFSGVGFDGDSLVAEEQLASSGDDNKRELGYSYFVSNKGELVVNGRQGMMSADGRMFFFDISNPETGRVGFAVGIKEARLQ